MFEQHSNSQPIRLHSLRIRLANPAALPELTWLGFLTGLFAGGMLIGFRELITFTSEHTLLPGDEQFMQLSPFMRFFLPVAGAVILISLTKLMPVNRRSFGITHVIDRLHFHHGLLPGLNIIGQFIGALVSLLSGFSVGREGPAVHMGAGAGSFLGQQLRLPDNSLRTLAGCGTAAAIAASFNTPMAAVIFAMEVVMREYSIDSFIPLMTASVTASLISQSVYGVDPAFIIPVMPMVAFHELSVTVVSAVIIGILAAAFIKLTTWIATKRKGMCARPLLLAGILMGTAGVVMPEVMGIGYDTITDILAGESFAIRHLVILVSLKLAITALVVGLGIPGGVIGPSLFIGAAVGTMLSLFGSHHLNMPLDHVYHALVGMVAMMAAVLQAPLAALITVLEMTHNPHIIMPAMLAIIIACLIAREVFKQNSLFIMQLKAGGQILDQHPLYDALKKTGVARLMTSSFELTSRYLNEDKVQLLSRQKPSWILFEDDNQVWVAEGKKILKINRSESDLERLDLMAIQNARPIQSVDFQATLNDALRTMNKHNLDMLYVQSVWKQKKLIVGLITRQAIEEFYS